ncbi:MAG: hypothetical protein GX028_08370 [Clostridiaceae bacterium]|nr:hypothetical protein [Clostridiaceae bacterium]
MNEHNYEFAEDVACPTHARELDVDLCEDYQMQGNAEFVPRVIEDELAELWVVQCKVCESMHGNNSDPLRQPEMVLE